MNSSNASPPSNAGESPQTTPESSAGQKAGNLKQAAREKTQQAKQAAAGAAQELKGRATGMVDERRNEVADRIGRYSSAIRDSGHSVENDDPNIAWLTNQAADRLQAVADYVRQRDYRELRQDVEGVARRHPAIVLGGMFLTGFIVGSVLKAGRTAMQDYEEESDSDYRYDPEPAAASSYGETAMPPAPPPPAPGEPFNPVVPSGTTPTSGTLASNSPAPANPSTTSSNL